MLSRRNSTASISEKSFLAVSLVQLVPVFWERALDNS
nr:MAG TPA_asm: hypothetical protein [Caudoviricetes sp.]